MFFLKDCMVGVHPGTPPKVHCHELAVVFQVKIFFMCECDTFFFRFVSLKRER